MNSGSRPCAPRYFEVVSPAPWLICVCVEVVSPSPWPPLMRAVADTSVPLIWAMMRSTGPPGANWTMAKLMSMIPNRVGTIRSRRLRR